jgi:hypothetical protein
LSASTRSGERSRGWEKVRSATRTARQIVHVEHSLRIDHPAKQLSASLVEGPATWFPRLKRDNVASVGLHVAGIPVRKKVVVEFGEPARTSTWAVVPVTWRATFPERLFPVMTGKVSLSPIGKDETRLTVSGVYEPPLGKLGEELNKTVMRTVARATVKELAQQIAERLAKAVRT